jgi:hypothetical protein
MNGDRFVARQPERGGAKIVRVLRKKPDGTLAQASGFANLEEIYASNERGEEGNEREEESNG